MQPQAGAMGLRVDGEGEGEGGERSRRQQQGQASSQASLVRLAEVLSVCAGQERELPQDCQLTLWVLCPWGCPCTVHPGRQKCCPHCHAPLCTWCRAGRLPPRLYHVMVAWGCPATTQFRSKVCPSTTVGDEDSIRIGGETLGTGTERVGCR